MEKDGVKSIREIAAVQGGASGCQFGDGETVGTALFAATRARANLLRLAAINATIRADNCGGLAYYFKMGFVAYGVDTAVPLSDATPVDRIHKRYMLGAG